MKSARVRQTLFIILILCSAMAAKVTVDWDKQASFTGYKTYAWQEGTPAKNPLMDQRVVDTIDKQLSVKGLQKVESDKDPDLVIVDHAAVGTETELNTTNMGGWGWRWGGGMATTTVDKIPVEQLVVDIGDAKTKKLLWLSSASGTLSGDPDKNTKKINDAVQQMFKKFPPPAGFSTLNEQQRSETCVLGSAADDTASDRRLPPSFSPWQGLYDPRGLFLPAND